MAPKFLCKPKVCYHKLSSTDDNGLDLEGVEERTRRVKNVSLYYLHVSVPTRRRFLGVQLTL